MKVRVDADLCRGHGRCYTLAPSLFAPDDLGDAYAIGDAEVPAAEVGLARLAVANCPERAVTVLDAGGES